ncbi:cysteine-rich KTR domain-containing protein [Neglectibacter timonensis]
MQLSQKEIVKCAKSRLCPICGGKTRLKIREDTVLKNYPLYCPKCKQETLIEAENLKVTIIKKQEH